MQALDDAEVQSLFQEEEFEAFLQNIRRQLFPALADVRQRWEREHDPDDPAEEHMQKLLERFDILSNHFGDDEEAVTILSGETKRARQWIVSYTRDEPSKGERTLGEVETALEPESTRSIFDDIDA